MVSGVEPCLKKGYGKAIKFCHGEPAEPHAHGSAGTITEESWLRIFHSITRGFHSIFFHQQNAWELQSSVCAHKRLKKPLNW
jgi:hypothetical protein